jgi:hypothetical protein
MTTATENNPSTWTDGNGVHYASVPRSDSPQRDAKQARTAILEALPAPGPKAPRPGKRTISVTRHRVTGHGTVIYRAAKLGWSPTSA